MATPNEGRVVALALKAAHGAPMRVVAEARVTVEGLDGNVAQRPGRRITFISSEQWQEVQQVLGTDLPWHARRANILVEGLPLGELIGKGLRVGEAEVLLQGETRSCAQMEAIWPGLQAALGPDCRGGVYGSVQKPGTIRAGDTVSVLE